VLASRRRLPLAAGQHACFRGVEFFAATRNLTGNRLHPVRQIVIIAIRVADRIGLFHDQRRVLLL
jgi:hypothetical protein